MTKTKMTLIGASALALSIFGTSTLMAQSTGNQQIDVAGTSLIDQVAAETIALEAVTGEIVKVKTDTEDGQDVFEIYIIAEDGKRTEVEIDRLTGEVIDIETKKKRKHDKDKDCDNERDDDESENEDNNGEEEA